MRQKGGEGYSGRYISSICGWYVTPNVFLVVIDLDSRVSAWEDPLVSPQFMSIVNCPCTRRMVAVPMAVGVSHLGRVRYHIDGPQIITGSTNSDEITCA